MAKSSAATRPAATRRTRLLVATRKGLWTLTSDIARNGWRLAGPQFLGHTIHHAVVDRRDGKTMLAAARTGHLGPTVFRSTDSGRTWTRVEHDLPGQPEFTALVAVPAPVDTLVAIVDGAVMASRDAGRTWRLAGAGLPAGGAEGLSVDPSHPGRLWIGSAGQIFSSEDGGARWQAAGVPLPEIGTSVRSVAADADGRGRNLGLVPHRARPGPVRSTFQ